MKIVLDLKKSAQENAAHYYEEAKKLRGKAEGTKEAIVKTKEELKVLEAEPKKPEVKIKRKREWYEKFHWFFSNDGFLVIGGRDAKQNESIFSKYFDENDLFMHADIHGAPVVIIKNGLTAPEGTLNEAAQFAANYSNAWKEELAAVDVYAAKREQVGKYSHGEVVAKGGFVIKGERKWFRNVGLGAFIGISQSGVECVPEKCGSGRFSVFAKIEAGGFEKGEVASKLGKLLSKEREVGIDELVSLLPPGKGHLES
jgi:predicted ribosome quality control (RQC) complex YloA/Tae2 family protein